MIRTFHGGLVCAAFFLLLCCALPLKDAVTLGSDEQMELTKAALVARAPGMLSKMWNDQPMLHTLLVGGLFRLLGPSVLCARSVTVGATVLLLLAMTALLGSRTGGWGMLWAAWLMLSSYSFLEVSVSAMLEVPAFAVAAVSAALVRLGGTNARWRWAAAGALSGAALHIKLTAALALPATAALVLLRTWQIDRRNAPEAPGIPLRHWLLQGSGSSRRCCSLWATALVGTYMILAWALPGWSFERLWQSHAEASQNPVLANSYQFRWGVLMESPLLMPAAALGFLSRVIQRRVADLVFPGVFFATVALVHTFHRPWWYYYQVHFIIPLALFAGMGAEDALALALSKWSKLRSQPLLARVGLFTGITTVLSLFIGLNIARFKENITDLRGREKVSESNLIATIERYAAHTHWLVAHNSEYAFHAGLLIPPEVAVLPLKRYWSGRIIERDVTAAARRYQAEQVLLWTGALQKHKCWRELLTKDYVLAYADSRHELFVRKELNPTPVDRDQTKRLLQKLGL